MYEVQELIDGSWRTRVTFKFRHDAVEHERNLRVGGHPHRTIVVSAEPVGEHGCADLAYREEAAKLSTDPDWGVVR